MRLRGAGDGDPAANRVDPVCGPLVSPGDVMATTPTRHFSARQIARHSSSEQLSTKAVNSALASTISSAIATDLNTVSFYHSASDRAQILSCRRSNRLAPHRDAPRPLRGVGPSGRGRRRRLATDPRLARGAAAALINELIGGDAHLLGDSACGLFELRDIWRGLGHRHRHAVRREQQRCLLAGGERNLYSPDLPADELRSRLRRILDALTA